MAYSELLAEKIRVEFLTKSIENREIKMMGGLCFMVDEKMCVGVMGDTLMARLDPEIYNSSIGKNGCSEMKFTGRPMKGFVIVDLEEVDLEEVDADYDLAYWVDLCLDYNPKAKASKKKRKNNDK